MYQSPRWVRRVRGVGTYQAPAGRDRDRIPNRVDRDRDGDGVRQSI